MAQLPTVAIIGRPNTGKSTLFNRLTGRRRAIVSDVAGTTRDRVAAKVEKEKGVDYLLMDTGGIGGGSEDHELEDNVAEQSLLALESADLILFTVNGKEDITSSDETVADLLRRKRKRHVPVILVVTKCDSDTDIEAKTGPYHALGVADDILGISATHNAGIYELEESMEKHLLGLHFIKTPRTEIASDAPPRIAVVGKPNVGKSSLLNALMSDPEREKAGRIVSPIAGTTRDTSDTIIMHEGKPYVFVDTAGIRKRSAREEGIEHYAMLRSVRAIEDSDIVILLLDATEPELSKQDKRLAAMAVEAGKGLILLVNKIDLLNTLEENEKLREIFRSFPFCTFAPILKCSAVTRERLPKMFPVIDTILQNRLRRISTKDLHRWYDHAVERLPAKALLSGKHITQADEVPPTFILFSRNPKNIVRSHLAYLERNLRSTFGFDGTPVRFITRES